jgi:hypothetical protein
MAVSGMVTRLARLPQITLEATVSGSWRYCSASTSLSTAGGSTANRISWRDRSALALSRSRAVLARERARPRTTVTVARKLQLFAWTGRQRSGAGWACGIAYERWPARDSSAAFLQPVFAATANAPARAAGTKGMVAGQDWAERPAPRVEPTGSSAADPTLQAEADWQRHLDEIIG